MAKQLYSKRPANSEPESVVESDKQLVEDAKLVSPAADPVSLLHLCVHLLIVARTRVERSVVTLHYYHGLTLAAVADAMELTERRVVELQSSLISRLQKAQEIRAANVMRAELDGAKPKGLNTIRNRVKRKNHVG